MPITINYTDAYQTLKKLFDATQNIVEEKGAIELSEKVIEDINKLVAAKTQSYREVALGCALIRLLSKEFDLTLPYANMGDRSYNGRSLDERVINPLLQEYEVPASKGPCLAMFRRSVRFDQTTRSGVRDKIGYDSLLNIIGYLESLNAPEEIESVIKKLLHGFFELRDASRIALARLKRLHLQQYSILLDKFLETSSGGLIPVFVTIALLKTISNCHSLNWQIEWQGINEADNASGAGGDVTVLEDGKILCVYEVTERPIEAFRVVLLTQKL